MTSVDTSCAQLQVHRLGYALSVAQRAVDLDQSMRYTDALLYYKAAYSLIVAEAGSSSTPRDVSKVLSKRAEMYLDRMDDIRRYKPHVDNGEGVNVSVGERGVQ